MNAKGIIWGAISYGSLWLAFTVFINIYGVPLKALDQLFVLCSVLAGVVAAKNSKVKPLLNAALSGGLVGAIFSVASLSLESGLIGGVVYFTIEVSLCFVVGAVIWWAASLLIRQ